MRFAVVPAIGLATHNAAECGVCACETRFFCELVLVITLFRISLLAYSLAIQCSLRLLWRCTGFLDVQDAPVVPVCRTTAYGQPS